jgi:plasmid stabilization system protein ParE
MTVRFVQEAGQEFLDAIRYYEEAGPGLGRRFRVELEATVRHLRDHPEIYRIRSADQRRINLKTFPFYLPFIIRSGTVWVLAVAHESRRPRYWISRRPPAAP